MTNWEEKYEKSFNILTIKCSYKISTYKKSTQTENKQRTLTFNRRVQIVTWKYVQTY